MSKHLLSYCAIILLLSACASNSKRVTNQHPDQGKTSVQDDQSGILFPTDQPASSLMDLPQTQDGGFVLKPGFYEAEFKTYCLQPGTPDPTPRDAYLQAPVRGYRKDIIETILSNSRNKPELDQRNIQLLLWNVVSGSDYNKLSYPVKATASQLLTQKQIFELKGGVMGVVKTVSAGLGATGILKANSDIQGLFNTGISSYESFERIAVLRQASKISRSDITQEKWHGQDSKYFVRYFPASYKKVKIQVYVPQGNIDSTGKLNGEYLVFDPTGYQAIPLNSNAQRLGVGAPVVEILRTIINIEKAIDKRKPQPQPERKTKDVKAVS